MTTFKRSDYTTQTWAEVEVTTLRSQEASFPDSLVLGWDERNIYSPDNRSVPQPISPTLHEQGMSILSAAGSLARTYQWPVSVRALTEHEAASGLSSIASCPSCGLPLLSLRMFPDFYPQIRDATLASSSPGWSNSGLAVGDGRYWTASTSESRNAAGVCTLSQVLQESVSPKYFLSAKAATGILRRAERRGKTLPPQLEAALVALASMSPDEVAKTTPT